MCEDSHDSENNSGLDDKSFKIVVPVDNKKCFTTLDHIRFVWNQLKFGWDLSFWPKFDRNEIIYLLGCRYTYNLDKFNSLHKNESITGTFSDFAQDFVSRLWFTYRDEFPPLVRHMDSHHLLANTSLSSEKNVPKNNVEVFLSSHDFINSDVNSNLAASKQMKVMKTFFSNESYYKKTKSDNCQQDPCSIPLSILTSDCGWGCMFRCGQMLIAQAFVVHFLGRNCKLYQQQRFQFSYDIKFQRQIIRWFNDTWDESSPLSLHRLVSLSKQNPGQWCGPSTICTALLRAMALANVSNTYLNQLKIYFARDRIIYFENPGFIAEALEKERHLLKSYPIISSSKCYQAIGKLCSVGNRISLSEIMNLVKGLPTRSSTQPKLHFTDHSANYNFDYTQDRKSSDETYAVILLIPLMLGSEAFIDSQYKSFVLNLFADPSFIGLIGGQPKHSCYFVGHQKNKLIYLDPHLSQPNFLIKSDDFPIDSWHCPIPKTMNVSKLDPSCAIGFYCRNRSELSDLLDRMPKLMLITNTTPSASYSRTSSKPVHIVEVLNYEQDPEVA